jgi:TrmH family RNA methyltransferase
MPHIESARNPRVVAVTRLHRRKHRRSDRRTILEGPHLIADALDAGLELLELFVLDGVDGVAKRAEAAGCPVFTVTTAVMDRLAPTEHPRGPVAVIHIPESAGPSHHDAVVLAGVSDPGNAGTLIRSAAAFGHDVVSGPGVDAWSPKVLRSAAGGHFRTRIVQIDRLEPGRFHDAGVATAALVVDGGRPLDSLGADPVALFVGSEPHGLAAPIIAGATYRVTIPMVGGQESLNAGVAGSIAMWERFRTRRRDGD